MANKKFEFFSLFLALKNNLKSDTSSSSTTTATTSSGSSNRAPRKRLLNILLNTNSTTEEDTEEEVQTTPASKKTKRRRRNFSSSTSSSYSSSLATNSTIHSSNVTPKKSPEGQQSKADLIAYRTRSRTQSVERVDTSAGSAKRKSSRRSQLLSDSEEESQEDSRATRAKKNSENNNKKDNSSVNSENNKSSSVRNLRSRSSVEPQTNLRRSTKAVAVPKKRQRVGEQHQEVTSAALTQAAESTGAGSKAPNLGARLSRNQSGREPATHTQQDTPTHAASTSTQSQTQTTPGHPPQNLLRRSSRGKGASSTSTTGSCVSFVSSSLSMT